MWSPTPVGLGIGPVEPTPGDLLAEGDGLEHGAVDLSPAADVRDLVRPPVLGVGVESADEVGGMDVVPHLFGTLRLPMGGDRPRW
jgi:hypothetical protein